MLHNKENRILKIVIYVVCISAGDHQYYALLDHDHECDEIDNGNTAACNFSSAIYTYDQKLEDSAWKKL